MITIYPTVTTVNAADKPYSASFYADADFVPATAIWTVNGRPRYATTVYTVVGSKYRVQGPSYTIQEAACTVSVVMTRQYSPLSESQSYTTEEQRDPATLSVTLVSQKDGIEITDGTSIPDTPIVTGVAGANQINLTWSKLAAGALPRSRVWVRVTASDYTGYINKLTVDWGDGNTDEHTYQALRDVLLDTDHEYIAATGSRTISVYHTTADGYTPGPADSVNLVVSAAAADWYAQQYEILRYREQPGFMQVHPVGWREIETGDRAVEMYDVRRANEYYCQLRLREVDYTGRPIRTSAYSAIASVGPWA